MMRAVKTPMLLIIIKKKKKKWPILSTDFQMQVAHKYLISSLLGQLITCHHLSPSFDLAYIVTLFGTPLHVTPGPELGASNSYGSTPAPHRCLRLGSAFLLLISCSIC